MTLQRFESVLNQLQKESPRVFDALTLLGKEVRTVLDNKIIASILSQSQITVPEQIAPDDIFKLLGWTREFDRSAIFTADRHDKVSVGGIATPSGVIQAEEITDDHLDHEVITLKRSREDTTPPNLGFGANLSFRLQGFSVGTEPEAGRVQVIWDRNQTNDITARDSTISLWNMLNNVLIKRFSVDSNGAVFFDATAFPAGRFLLTGAAGEIVTDPNVAYDETNDIVTFLASQTSTSNPQLVLQNNSTGDAYLRFSLSTAHSFAFGIDNSVDQLVLSYATAGAVLGTNNAFAIDTAGRMGYGDSGPSSAVKFQIFKSSAENIVLAVARADTSTSPTVQMNQTSTGDVSLQWTLGGGNSFAVGIDNSDNDYFKISYGSAANATLGVNDRLIIDLSGRILIGVTGGTFTAGRLVDLRHFEEGPWLYLESSFLNPAISLVNTGSGGRSWQILAPRTGGTAPGSFVVRDVTGASNRFAIDLNGNIIIGPLAALATTATNGFLYIPSCAGTPTGVPTAVTGKIPLVYDSTNNILYARSGGAWRAH